MSVTGVFSSFLGTFSSATFVVATFCAGSGTGFGAGVCSGTVTDAESGLAAGVLGSAFGAAGALEVNFAPDEPQNYFASRLLFYLFRLKKSRPDRLLFCFVEFRQACP